MSDIRSEVVQVTNVSPTATSEQLRTLFGHIGVLQDLVIYPPDNVEEPSSRVAYVRYLEPINAEVALHLNNTVFLDRALIVLPLGNGINIIPDEKAANVVRAPPNTAAGVLPRTADWPLDVISMVVGRPGEQVIHTIEPRLSSLSFPLYPPLPATTDGSRIEEIRRTILVTNLDPKTTGDQVLEFFNKHAEVRCVRMAGTEYDRAAYVEFTQQQSIVKAFGLMGATLSGRQIMVQHSNCAIIKPANSFALYDGGAKAAARSSRSSHRRSRSRSRSRDRRSRSRHGSHRRRSRSRDRKRSQSRHSKRRSRTRSRSRGRRRYSRSGSRDRRRGRHDKSRSRERRRNHRSRSRSGRRRSRSRSRGQRSDRRERDRGSIRSSRSDRDRRDRDYEYDKRDKDRVRRRDSKSRKRRESSRGRDEKELLDSTFEEKKRKPTDSRNHIEDSHLDSVRIERTISNERSRRDSSSGSGHSGVGGKNGLDKPNEEEPDSVTGAESDSKPTVVGVKLAGPEDMDSSMNKVPRFDDSDSSDAMDTEA